MKKTLIIISAVIIGLIAAAAAMTGLYLKSTDYTAEKFPSGTSINGIDCSGLTYDEASSKLSSEWNKKTLTVEGDLNDELAKYTNFNCTYDISKQLSSLKHDHLFKAAVNHYIHTPLSANIPMKVETCGEEFKEQVLSSEFLTIENATESTDAYVDVSDPSFPIVPEKQGTAIDKKSFLNAVLDHIKSGEFQLTFDQKKYTQKPKVTSDDEKLVEYQEFCKKYLKQQIHYQLGEESFTMSGEELSKLLKSDLSGKADEEAVKTYVSELAKKYNTVGIQRNFKSLAGKNITVKGGTYGWKIDQEKETEQLMQDIASHKDVDREPVYSHRGYGTYSRLLGNTYIDVDFTKQEVRYYNNGTLKFSCPVVTGCLSKGHATPTGTYFIINRLRNVVLRGDNGDGSQYESPVSYWMGITPTGIGFHDANWRSSFGGNIWKTSGSHGCVNMPPSRIPQMFKIVEVGMPVVMHY